MTVGNILVIGRSGQLARALARLGPIAGRRVECLGRPAIDLGGTSDIGRIVGEKAPALVINAAAYTAVDKAEREPGIARRINAEGPRILASACSALGTPIIHLSTDYVFDGGETAPYREDDPIGPLGVYGASKAAGEAAVRTLAERHIIVRTAWVYSEDGQNFLNTMLRLGAERPTLRIVNDQHGTPTYAGDIAEAIDLIAERILGDQCLDAWGTYHFTNAGRTTWFGFAEAIFEVVRTRGGAVPRLEPITTADFPALAARPTWSVLDTEKIRARFGVTPAPWRKALERCLARHPAMARHERAQARRS